MKRNFLLLVLLKITSISFAQTFCVINQYSGTIGKSSITATIRIVDTTITGSYYYSKIGDLLYLVGSMHGEKAVLYSCKAGQRGRNRSHVDCRSVLPVPRTSRNCLGLEFLLYGQKRTPTPPAIRTTNKFLFI